MTTTPNFDDLTPPDELVQQWSRLAVEKAIYYAYTAGARHGWEQARQLWPEPIMDRPPTEMDGDDFGFVQFFNGAGWGLVKWHDHDNHFGWAHTPRWQPRQPSLQEQALKVLNNAPGPDYPTPMIFLNPEEIDLIRRALEQAGEGKS